VKGVQDSSILFVGKVNKLCQSLHPSPNGSLSMVLQVLAFLSFFFWSELSKKVL